ncbi:MAG: hypothetical protein H0W42_11925 [Gemmatimonadaceae bacterium]|nr:hypothetical protein [Gemmatimonadaceae bacterium]
MGSEIPDPRITTDAQAIATLRNAGRHAAAIMDESDDIHIAGAAQMILYQAGWIIDYLEQRRDPSPKGGAADRFNNTGSN